MNFELLPNETLILCFQYLNAPDLFNAFDGLNYRFQRLITNIPLSLNFQHIKKTTFEQFCQRMLFNPEIKSQIISLQLSDGDDTCGQISSFLSSFSLNEFPNIRSLTLVEAQRCDMERFSFMLPSLSNLSYFYCDALEINSIILSTLPFTNLRKLNVICIRRCPIITQKVSLITHLTLKYCGLDDFNNLFPHIPMLKYLKVERLINSVTDELTQIVPIAVSLTQFDLCTSHIPFNNIEKILKQMPNLRIFKLSNVSYEYDMIDADRWQNLISSSLPHLCIFKFYFTFLYIINDNNYYTKSSYHAKGEPFDKCELFNKCKQFQTEFWTEQHHWHIAYEWKTREMRIFTVPYLKDYYKLTSDAEFYCNDPSIDKSKIFDNVTKLTIFIEEIVENANLKFSNVESLTLENAHICTSTKQHRTSVTIPIEILKNNVNLFTLKHLGFYLDAKVELASVFIEIFKKAPNLSSISIDIYNLLSLLNNDELCKYFNKMITELEIYGRDCGIYMLFNTMSTVYKTFTNVEKLKCAISELESLLELMNAFPKLSHLFVWSSPGFGENTSVWIQNNLLPSNAIYRHFGSKLNIWIGKV